VTPTVISRPRGGPRKPCYATASYLFPLLCSSISPTIEYIIIFSAAHLLSSSVVFLSRQSVASHCSLFVIPTPTKTTFSYRTQDRCTAQPDALSRAWNITFCYTVASPFWGPRAKTWRCTSVCCTYMSKVEDIWSPAKS
jgi:hypothetical protein